MIVQPWPWLAAYADHKGLRYEPDADERWIRMWEPYATLRIPVRYEHALYATGADGSMTIARMVFPTPLPPHMAPRPGAMFDASAWVAIAQDEMLSAELAVTSDPGSPFAEPLSSVSMSRRNSGDPYFDAAFCTFLREDSAIEALTPSLRRLLLSWRIPLHAEFKKGGFVLAPVALPPDLTGLRWLVHAIPIFSEKARKRQTTVL